MTPVARDARTRELIVADHLAPADRPVFWTEVFARAIAPVEIDWCGPGSFTGPVQLTDLGVARVAMIGASDYEARRTPRMIGAGDPASWQLVVNHGSRAVLTQRRRTAVLGPSDMALYCTSRPLRLRTRAGAGGSGLVVLTPAAPFPLPEGEVERIATTVLSGRTGIGALLAGYLSGLAGGAGPMSPADAVRLGTILLDLLVALLAHELDALEPATVRSRERALVLRVLSFIEANLTEPGLSPAGVAAAHHISVRQLHRLFEGREQGVAGWIRARRLAGARRELADPARADRPIHLVAARWGFPNAAHFSRSFRAAYGLTPNGYRHAAGRRAAG